ncbi:hypothetical protein I553_3546 [Mycobacterium xenopi 4042]|uniref:Uncharacterized protein n=1 Tax=Mycobacterium xenopi 4042 TaxID=1299334 RepID=X8AKY1_MYCXE|nr:hypothetical protein I553_3546 [Mycobacterium xenopi 4042]
MASNDPSIYVVVYTLARKFPKMIGKFPTDKTSRSGRSPAFSAASSSPRPPPCSSSSKRFTRRCCPPCSSRPLPPSSA